jgi:hypothetical protein
MPVLIFNVIKPDYNFFNDLLYYEYLNAENSSSLFFNFIFRSEIDQGFFTPIRILFEVTPYLFSFNNPTFLLIITSWICISVIIGYMKILDIFYKENKNLLFSLFLIFIFLWPWTLDLFLFPGTVEKFLILWLLFIFLYIKSNFFQTKPEWIVLILFLLLILIGMLLRIQFLTFLVGVIYYAFNVRKFKLTKILMFVIAPILGLSFFLFKIFLEGDYTSKSYFSIRKYVDSIFVNLLYPPNWIFIGSLIILAFFQFYAFMKFRNSKYLVFLNSWFLIIFNYSLALIMWGEYGFHLSILGIFISVYLISFLQLNDNIVVFTHRLKSFFIPVMILVTFFFSTFKILYTLNPAVSLRDFFYSDTVKELNNSEATINLNCVEGAERISIFANRYLINHKLIFRQMQDGINFEYRSRNSYILVNNTFCPYRFENNTKVQLIWSSDKFNSYKLYKFHG